LAGTLAAAGELHVHALVLLLIAAAIAGDSLNTHRRYLGPRVSGSTIAILQACLRGPDHAFFRAPWRQAIIIARFVPIIRTYAFRSGHRAMSYRRFSDVQCDGGGAVGSAADLCRLFLRQPALVRNNLTGCHSRIMCCP